MRSAALKALAALTVFALSAGNSFADDQDRTRDRDRDRERVQEDEPVYGHQLMSREERMAYRQRMRAATSAEERERIRAEHHEQMKKRAKERGVTLPDEPPMRPGGMGPGPGMGGGMGPMNGMGGRR